MNVETIAAIAFILGPIGRTAWDYLWKLKENPETQFDRKYIVTLAASLGISLIVGIFYLPSVLGNIPEGSTAYIFFSTFSTGFTLNHLINTAVSSTTTSETATKNKTTDQTPT